MSDQENNIQTQPSLSVDMKSVYLGGLFLIAVFTVCYVAAGIILPLVLACVLKLVLQPIMRFLDKLHIPRMLSAVLLIIALLGIFAGIGAAISTPAADWGQKLGNDIPKLQDRISYLSAPVIAAQKLIHRAESFTTSNSKVATVAVAGPGLSDKLFSGAGVFASGFFEMIIILLFLLASGDTFLRRLVEVLPRFQDKKQAVHISQHIEHDIAAYLMTITFMNVIVGSLTAIIMWTTGVGDPILWGTVAFLFNYVPILGPIVCALLFVLVGLIVTTGSLGAALLPAGLYFCVHLMEGEFVTPMLLARRFTLNPVLVILSLIFWYWMWGVVGAVLATPMLAIFKIICDRIEHMKPLGHFIEG